MTVTIKLTVEGEERDIFINFVPETGLGKDCAIKQDQRSKTQLLVTQLQSISIRRSYQSSSYSKLVLVS